MKSCVSCCCSIADSVVARSDAKKYERGDARSTKQRQNEVDIEQENNLDSNSVVDSIDDLLLQFDDGRELDRCSVETGWKHVQDEGDFPYLILI